MRLLRRLVNTNVVRGGAGTAGCTVRTLVATLIMNSNLPLIIFK